MRTLQYMLAEQLAVTQLAVHGLMDYVAEDMAIEGSSEAKEAFYNDLNAVRDKLNESRLLLLKHRESPMTPANHEGAQG